jgi:hypothetical protein
VPLGKESWRHPSGFLPSIKLLKRIEKMEERMTDIGKMKKRAIEQNVKCHDD